MNAQQIGTLLAAVAAGRLTPDAALDRLRQLPFEDLPFARIDHHRALRQGQPEVVFCEGKTPEQVAAICERLAAMSGGFLGTRCGEAHAQAVLHAFPEAVWSPLARTVHLLPEGSREAAAGAGTILVVSAGTSDLPVAEEAAVVAEVFGHRVDRLVDVGVAGLHRLLASNARLREADVVIVVAGMEGALPSVVGGLVAAVLLIIALGSLLTAGRRLARIATHLKRSKP